LYSNFFNPIFLNARITVNETAAFLVVFPGYKNWYFVKEGAGSKLMIMEESA
jgi:hypothetical protein